MDVKRSSFSPNPAIDETAYSWLLRYHMMSGNLGMKRDTLSSLGVTGARPTNEFPAYLTALSRSMAYPLEHIIHDMTPYHYYAAFLSDEDRQQLWQHLVTGNTSALQTRLGNVAGRITPGQMLYYCPSCVEDDINQYGFPFWHVSHQLVGVIACCRHQVLLQCVSRVVYEVPVPQVAIARTSAPKIALRLAEFAMRLQAERKFSITHSFDEHYRERLRAHELLTPEGRIRMRPLRNLMWNQLKQLTSYNEVYQTLAALLKRHHYPESLFYNSSRQHPIKHLMLASVLYQDFDDFNELVSHPIALSDNPNNPSLSIERCRLSPTARHFLKHGESLRTVSADEGLSVSTLKILAQQEGIQLSLRPYKIFSVDERSMLMKLVMGLRTQTIAKIHGVSVGAIEQVLRKHPELVVLRKKMRFNVAKYQHRKALTQCMEKYPTLYRQQLRDKVSASYCWLYKHDKSWLYKVLPARQEYQNWPRKHYES
ncbi:TnsD family transposase [Shewanella sp. A3A]|nr:TnsD family transposase [Shewanella ferrihydritica]